MKSFVFILTAVFCLVFNSCTDGDYYYSEKQHVVALEGAEVSLSGDTSGLKVGDTVGLTVSCITDYEFYRDYEIRFYVCSSDAADSSAEAEGAKGCVILGSASDDDELNFNLSSVTFTQNSELVEEQSRTFYVKGLLPGKYNICVRVRAQAKLKLDEYVYSKDFVLDFSEE